MLLNSLLSKLSSLLSIKPDIHLRMPQYGHFQLVGYFYSLEALYH